MNHTRLTIPTARLQLENRVFPHDHVLFDDRVGFAIATIPKVGCTVIKRWYAKLVHPELDAESIDIHKYCLERLMLSARSRESADATLRDVPIIAFVRDPADRLRSAFVEKIVRPSPTDPFEPAAEMLLERWRAERSDEHNIETTQEPLTASDAADALRRGISFREFVHLVCNSPVECLDPHWRPQIAFVRPFALSACYPLSALSAVLDKLGRTRGQFNRPVPVANVTRKERSSLDSLSDTASGVLHLQDLRPPTDQLVDEEIRACIETRLRDDVQLHQASQNWNVISNIGCFSWYRP